VAVTLLRDSTCSGRVPALYKLKEKFLHGRGGIVQSVNWVEWTLYVTLRKINLSTENCAWTHGFGALRPRPLLHPDRAACTDLNLYWIKGEFAFFVLVSGYVC